MNTQNTPLRVLVVDDDPFAIELFWSDLPRDLFEVVTAENGADAFDLLSGGRFDLLVADVLMPVVDGVRLVNLVRETPEIKNLPIVVITSSLSDDLRAECLKAGADQFLTKPFRTSELPERLKQAVAHRAQAEAVV